MLKNFFARFRSEEDGATAIEYGLLAALIAVAIVIVVYSLGQGLGTTFNKVDTNVRAAPAQSVTPTSGGPTSLPGN